MNPSTRDILDAIESSPAAEIVVLPNNANIIPVARQAAAATDSRCTWCRPKGSRKDSPLLLTTTRGRTAVKTKKR